MIGHVSTTSSPVVDLLLGVVLIAIVPLVYWGTPRFNQLLRAFWFRGPLRRLDRQDGSWESYDSVHRVLAALFFAAVGTFAIVAGIVQLVRGR